MYSATFTYAPRQFDEDFHALDQRIADMARALPGYVGEESWENAATGVVANVYYFETRDALDTLMRHPDHLRAKQEQARWLAGYQVVVAEVIGCHGDGGLAHPLAGRAMPMPREPGHPG